MLRMDQVHIIRHQLFVERKGIRRIAREMGVSRNTVRKYRDQAEPKRIEITPRGRPAQDRIRLRFDELIADWSPRTTVKQRITATRLYRQLREEGYSVGLSTVKLMFREWKRRRQEVFIPLVHRAGEAQVDFFEVVVEVQGERRKAWMFLLRLMASGRDFVRLYDRADQVSFLDGHVRAFHHLGGHPHRITYDNLKSAVKKVLCDGRELTDAFLRLTSHYPFEACFARPGEGHDKGGVEGRGKNLRLQHLAPIPRGPTLDEISRQLLSHVDASMTTRRNRAGRSVADRFAKEMPHLRPLPAVPHDIRRVCSISVSSKALVRVDGSEYSVPSRWAGLDATAYVGVDRIEIRCRDESTEVEKVAKGTRSVRYRDYLPELARKPQAVRQVAPELLAELGEPFERFWNILTAVHEPRKAARVLAAVLAAIVRHGEQDVGRALEATLRAGETDLFRLLTRLGDSAPPAKTAVPDALMEYQIEQACKEDYDALLFGNEDRKESNHDERTSECRDPGTHARAENAGPGEELREACAPGGPGWLAL